MAGKTGSKNTDEELSEPLVEAIASMDNLDTASVAGILQSLNNGEAVGLLDAPISESGGAPNVLDELQSGRTRELLLLLQDRPIPEVQDPMNVQSSLSNHYRQDGSDYLITGGLSDTLSYSATFQTESYNTPVGNIIEAHTNITEISGTISSPTDTVTAVEVRDSNGTTIASKSGEWTSGDSVTISNLSLSAGSKYQFVVTAYNGFIGTASSVGLPISGPYFTITGAISYDQYAEVFDSISVTSEKYTGYVTDRFSAPSIEPTSFQQWNAIRARDVTAGGSTSANPVEFDILDSSDTTLNSSRIPASEIADSAFRFRDREWVATATGGQTTFTIPGTGAGGHYGIPIFEVIAVEKNGSVLDPSAWEFDGTDTVTLTNSASDGDTITVSYDFGVFDSTLQPRAYLSRETTSEQSPSISHFRYEYIV